jgi:hypothetical protein
MVGDTNVRAGQCRLPFDPPLAYRWAAEPQSYSATAALAASEMSRRLESSGNYRPSINGKVPLDQLFSVFAISRNEWLRRRCLLGSPPGMVNSISSGSVAIKTEE